MTAESSGVTAAREYLAPKTVEEALIFARRYRGEYEYYAGGTDAQVNRLHGLPAKPVIIDLSGIRELGGVKAENDALHIGSLVTLSLLEQNPVYPLIAEAAASVATPVIRKTATLGGNLLVNNRCFYYNQSNQWRTASGSCLRDTGDTCQVTGIRNGKCFSRNVSDMAPALIALNAQVTIRNQREELTIPLEDLYAQDGIRNLQHVEDDGILIGVRVLPQIKAWGYRKLRLRRSLDFTSLTVAACLNMQGEVRICLNGVSMAPVVIFGRLADLTLEMITKQAQSKSKLVDNDFMPFEYRKEMLAVYLEDLWHALHEF